MSISAPSEPASADRPDEIPAQYDPAATEPAIYQRWIDAGCFTARAEQSTRAGGSRDPFGIFMPPPNVTAVLHVGHGLNHTVQDVLVRWARMRGAEAVWLPGTDHAGIATQNIVEKLLAAEGQSRDDIGREPFVERTRSFVERTGGIILEQLRAIGASADWSRTAYTLSPALSEAVREAFVRLYERGLIYRGHRVIHWCPRCLTSLSDEEAEPTETAGTLYHIAYPVADEPARSITVATTRPETMLGDVAVAVHPDDARYADLVGRTVVLPLLDLPIPVVADGYADPAFGTGVVKITPAHDANDFEVGRRHGLAAPVVIDEHGILNEGPDARGRVPASLRGVDRFEARRRIVAQLETSGRLVRMEPHQHNVRHCYRCDTVVEPRLSDQWFVRMAPLAEPALRAVQTGRVRIVPDKWVGVYEHWLTSIRDWNISRQLWWGHRVPVWYCAACDPPDNVIASRTDLERCPGCGGPVVQDADVLDTWFSSWLWPISTLGWPADTADLRAFYPGDVLVSGPDILFFWVARMIMAGYAFMGDAPFHTVFLHGIVRDARGRKMSKSLGNGIDPMDVVQSYGADALRYTLIAGMGMGSDVLLDHEDVDKSFAPGRNFATKLWNIGRFLLGNVGAATVRPLGDVRDDALARADHWILDRLDVAIRECDRAIGPMTPTGDRWRERERAAGLRLNEYAEAARRFVWNELADWYLEAIKGRLLAAGDDREVARAVLVHVFDRALRLLHPVVPFITESLWQRLPAHVDGTFLATTPWPVARAGDGSPAGAEEFEWVREAIVALRGIRSEYAVAPSRVITAAYVGGGARSRIVADEGALVQRLTRTTLAHVETVAPTPAATAILGGGAELVVPLEGLVDVGRECARLRTELAALETQLRALDGRLANAGFVSRAPAHVVEAERTKRTEWHGRATQLRARIEALCGAG